MKEDKYMPFIIFATFDRFIAQLIKDMGIYTDNPFEKDEKKQGVFDFLKFFWEHADDPEKVYDLYQERYSKDELTED
jgi:hypothetical protein